MSSIVDVGSQRRDFLRWSVFRQRNRTSSNVVGRWRPFRAGHEARTSDGRAGQRQRGEMAPDFGGQSLIGFVRQGCRLVRQRFRRTTLSFCLARGTSLTLLLYTQPNCPIRPRISSAIDASDRDDPSPRINEPRTHQQATCFKASINPPFLQQNLLLPSRHHLLPPFRLPSPLSLVKLPRFRREPGGMTVRVEHSDAARGEHEQPGGRGPVGDGYLCSLGLRLASSIA